MFVAPPAGPHHSARTSHLKKPEIGVGVGIGFEIDGNVARVGRTRIGPDSSAIAKKQPSLGVDPEPDSDPEEPEAITG